MMSLNGKVAIVTGGNRGICQAIVLELARLGANAVIDYVCHQRRPRSSRSRSPNSGDQSIGVEADASKLADLQMLVERRHAHADAHGWGRARQTKHSCR